MHNIKTVSIELKPGVYNQFRALNNKVWYALSEYVDNAVQSYLNNSEQLQSVEPKYKLIVKISINWEANQIVIEDNAAGINETNFQRAFEPANKHINNSGLNEFGMGMKTASIWLANKWEVYTKAINEDVERYVEFDLKKVISEQQENLNVVSVPMARSIHYTKIILTELSENAPKSMQMNKIKKHLASIYRKFIREDLMQLYVNDELLSYKDPRILTAPYFKKNDGENIYWRKDINFQYGKYKAVGFIAILETMSTNEHNGFSLFRRGRVILGSHDEKYHPKVLCGQSGSPRDKRIFGELELEGFDVSFNKSSFQDEGDLGELMELLKEEITNPNFDLYGQAEAYRLKPKEETQKVARQIASSFKKEMQPHELTRKVKESVKNVQDSKLQNSNARIVEQAASIAAHEAPFAFDDNQYTFKIEFINEPSSSDLYSLRIEKDSLFESKTIECKINLAHSFFVRFDKIKTKEDYQPIVSIIKALALAEVIAPSQDTKNAGNIRLLFNQFIQSL